MKSPASFRFLTSPGRLACDVSSFRFGLTCILMAVGALALTNSADAAGIEETVGGGVALGRAANYSRANDYMAILQNPANLAVIPGHDLGGELRLPLLNTCFDRAKDNNPSIQYRVPTETFDGSESFGNVCNSAAPFPTGNLGFVQSFKKGWGYGVGFFTPPGVAQSKFGKDTIVTVQPSMNESATPTNSGVEWPNRYLLLSRRALLGWLMAGIGWQPHRMFRLGASFGAGFFTIENKSVVSIQGGTFKDQEVVNTINTHDLFVPRATASFVLQPVDSFELFGSLMYQDDVHATGHSDQVANGIKGAPRRDCYTEKPGPNCRINDVTLDVPFPTFEATVGLRYASRRKARKRVIDPLKDEIWDIAVEGFWAQTSHVENFVVTLFDANLPNDEKPHIQVSSDLDTTRLIPQQEVRIPHYWKDTFGARIGGDYNVVPNILSLRLGLSYSSSALRARYANIDSFTTQKIGLHAGLTVTTLTFLKARSSLTLAYAHLFYSPVTVPVGKGAVRDIAAVAPEAANPVNEGYYQTMMDVISVQSNVTF